DHEAGETIGVVNSVSGIRAKAGSFPVTADYGHHPTGDELIVLSIIKSVRYLAWRHNAAHHHVGLAEVTPNEVAEAGNLPWLSNRTQVLVACERIPTNVIDEEIVGVDRCIWARHKQVDRTHGTHGEVPVDSTWAGKIPIVANRTNRSGCEQHLVLAEVVDIVHCVGGRSAHDHAC